MNFFIKGVSLLAIASIFVSCQSSENQSADSQTDESSISTSLPAIEFSNVNDEKVYSAYIQLKDALVLADSKNAKLHAQALEKEMAEAASMNDILIFAKNIASSDDLKEQRKVFTDLSTGLIAKFKETKLNAGKIFVQHCPMANNGDGGDWLSSESNIRNPYYGDQMMECGSVIEEIIVK